MGLNKIKELAKKLPDMKKIPVINKFSALPKKKKRIMAVIGGGVLILLLVLAAYHHREAGRTIKVSGNIEGDEVRISFRVGGQIDKLLTDEGMYIKTGDIVAVLVKDQLGRQYEEAEAALKLGRFQYDQDRIDYDRAENLYKEGAVSAQQRDLERTKADTSRSNLEQLTAAYELAKTQLGWADLASPLNGFITLKSALQGEVVQEGAPVFTAIDLNNIWVTAYINEKDLGRVKLGAKAHVSTDSYPGKKYAGWVSFISQQTEFTPKYIQTTEERVKYVYRIKVRVDNSSLDLKPGMPADAYIIVED